MGLVDDKRAAVLAVEHESVPVDELTVSGRRSFVRQSVHDRLEEWGGNWVAELVGDAIFGALAAGIVVWELGV